MSDEQVQTITRLLNEAGAGKGGAAEQLIPFVYKELRAIAGKQFRSERRDHTLEPTALVHEAFVKLVGQEKGQWQNRAQFFAIASRVMRRILVDHARTKASQRRGGDFRRITLDTPIAAMGTPDVDIIDLDDALNRLSALNERRARVVELRFFSGLDFPEIAELMELSRATVVNEARFARAWLARELGAGERP